MQYGIIKLCYSDSRKFINFDK